MFAWIAMVAAIAPALSGHAAGEESPVLPVLADTLHVLAAGSWAGSLAILGIVAIPSAIAEPQGAGGVAVLAMLRRFTSVALGSAAALLVTGVYASWLHVGSFAALWSSRYGHSLLLKLALLGGMGLLGAINWRRLGPEAGTKAGAHRLARSAWLELAFAVAIVLVTAVLVARPDPSGFAP
jgi:copper transport protein